MQTGGLSGAATAPSRAGTRKAKALSTTATMRTTGTLVLIFSAGVARP